MTNAIRITADETLKLIDFEKLEPLQGSLKSLSQTNFEKLKKSVIDRGFFVPVFIWNNGQSIKLIDGHQRLRLLQVLKKEGWIIPKIPYVNITAKTAQEAKQQVLAISSTFGTIERQGLYEFLEDIDTTLLTTDFALPEIELNTPSFMDEYFHDIKQQEIKNGATELLSDDFEIFNEKCPKCGFEFDAHLKSKA